MLNFLEDSKKGWSGPVCFEGRKTRGIKGKLSVLLRKRIYSQI
jgi:hypothetical protein